jgi:CRISPR-associated protein Csc1
MQVVEATIETKGGVWFASREVGRLADTAKYILNTALHYALGFAGGRYVDTTREPTYVEDTADIAEEVYVSPAAPLDGAEYWTTIYNARGDRYTTVNYAATDDPQQDLNIPRFGRRRSFSQANRFRCYLIPQDGVDADDVRHRLPRYVRLGKKRGKAEVRAETRVARRLSGEFTTSHPFGACDYDAVPVGSVISENMRPTPLILQADYEGEYLEIRTESKQESARVLPADLQFLKTKR